MDFKNIFYRKTIKKLEKENAALKERLDILEDKLRLNPKNFPILLSEKEKETFIKYVKNSKKYLEFGSGGSTFLAVLNSSTYIISVESDKKWIEYILEWKILEKNLNDRLKFHHANIGEVKDFGIPLNLESKEVFPVYSTEIFTDDNAKNADLVFIDGRFRVACLLQTILNTNAAVLFHDFWTREHYHIVLKYLDVVEKADSLAIFKKKENFNRDEALSDFEKYKYIWD